MQSIIDLINAIFKELEEAIQSNLGANYYETIYGEITTLMAVLPTLLHLDYMNPILSLTEMISHIINIMQNDIMREMKQERTIGMKQFIVPLLDGIYYQIRLPEDYSFEAGVDADYDYYRQSLKKVLVSLIKLYPEDYLSYLSALYSSRIEISKFEYVEWREAEASINMLFYFGDAVNVNMGNVPYREVFCQLLVSIIQSNVVTKHYHFSVILAYIETLSRFQQLLLPLKYLHYNILSAYIAGINSNKGYVREKSVTLLGRYVSALKEDVMPYQQGILDAVQTLIVLPTPDDAMKHAMQPSYYDSIYPLFYITSSIISGNWNSMEMIFSFYHNTLLLFYVNIASYKQQLRGNQTDVYIKRSIAYHIGCINSILKGIKDQACSALTSLSGDMLQEILQMLKLYMDLFDICIMDEEKILRNQMDCLIHRLILVLRDAIIPFTTDLISLYCSYPSYRSLAICLDVLSQLYATYKNQLDPYIDPLLGTITEKCFTDYDGDKDRIGEKIDICNGYYGLFNALSSTSSSLFYSTVNHAYTFQYLTILLQGVTTVPLIAVNKECVTTYNKLITNWIINGSTVPNDVKEVFIAHCIREVLPTLFSSIHLEQFNIKDPASITMINDIATFVFLMANHCESFNQYFFEVFLVNAGCTIDVINQFRQLLKKKRSIEMGQFLRSFFDHILKQQCSVC